MKLPRLRVAHALLALAALLAVLPMLVSGPSCGHDFDFHLLSWFEAASQFAHLHYPRWAFTPAWNAGEPRFVFYPPLSWMLGALLGLLLPWTLVPAVFTFLALTLSGLSMHRLARRYASPAGALLAATLYLANPYMLFTAYERTAYGELLAAAFLPLLFDAALAEKVRVLPIALALALVWLSNAPAAVMASYALAWVMALRLARNMPSASRLRMAAVAAGGVGLGLALAAFYILPAAYEQRWVQVNMAVIPGMRVSDHFLFHRMGSQSFDDLFHDSVVRTASLVALTMLTALAVALLAARPRVSPELRRRILLPLGTLAALIAFLLTPPSLFFWNHIPKLAFLQFPWRLTALLGVVLASSAAIVFSRLERVSFAAMLSLLLAAALVFAAWRLFHQSCDPEDKVAPRMAQFLHTDGTEPTDEYTPSAADNDSLGHADPPYWLAPADALNAPPPAPCDHRLSSGCRPLTHLELDETRPAILVLNLRQYPGWQLRLNGRIVAPAEPEREDGLLSVALPPGHDVVDVLPHRTPDETAGLALSGLATLLAARLGLKLRRDAAA